jgi:hypothetical protein
MSPLNVRKILCIGAKAGCAVRVSYSLMAAKPPRGGFTQPCLPLACPTTTQAAGLERSHPIGGRVQTAARSEIRAMPELQLRPPPPAHSKRWVLGSTRRREEQRVQLVPV